MEGSELIRTRRAPKKAREKTIGGEGKSFLPFSPAPCQISLPERLQQAAVVSTVGQVYNFNLLYLNQMDIKMRM